MTVRSRSLDPAWLGMFYGLVAILCFSLTLPLTKLALESFSISFISIGRSSIGGVLSGLILLATRTPWPKWRQWKLIFLVGLGIAFAFPLCIAFALQQTEASHGGVVLAILPLLTAILGSWMNREKHPWSFWALAVTGCATVLVYILWRTQITLVTADLWLLGASISAAVGYTVGTKLSKELGGLNTICWALVSLLPISLPTFVYLASTSEPLAAAQAGPIYAFAYLAIISQLFGFVPWYNGLRIGGIAKVSQVQLLQPFFTLFASAVFLNEYVEWSSWAVTILVVLQVYVVKKLPTAHAK